MRAIDEIIIHCSATAEGKDFKADDIRLWHVKGNGWQDIGYHFVIDLDGTVEVGRPVSKQGAHCSGHNKTTIGICYVGGCAADGKTPKDTRTEAQRRSLRWLVAVLRSCFPTIRKVSGHREYANKACPSFDVKAENY